VVSADGGAEDGVGEEDLEGSETDGRQAKSPMDGSDGTNELR
jgi:hypothetical protein